MKAEIITGSGGAFNILEPNQDDIHVEDIAQALSMQCRFNGHCLSFYSVAQHSIHVAELYEESYPPQNDGIMFALMHDAPEAYIGDVVTPLKQLLTEYKAIEARVEQAIMFKFGVFSDLTQIRPCVKAVDTLMLLAERRDLLPPSKVVWNIHNTSHVNLDLVPEIVPWPQEEAYERFIAFYERIHDGRS